MSEVARMGRPNTALTIGDADREQLRALVRSHSMPHSTYQGTLRTKQPEIVLQIRITRRKSSEQRGDDAILRIARVIWKASRG
jgi:hypothetical protein